VKRVSVLRAALVGLLACGAQAHGDLMLNTRVTDLQGAEIDHAATNEPVWVVMCSCCATCQRVRRR